MPETISNIINRVDHYKDLIAKKEELTKEYEDWNALFEDVEKEVRLVRMVYQVGGTKEAKEQLDSWLKERQDYLVMIAKYRRKINAIDKELEEFEQKDLNSREDYLAILTELREKVLKLEKIGNKSSIGVHLAKVVNPYGHEKLIKAEDVEEYNNLVSEIISLSQQLEDKHNLVFNGVSTEEIKEDTKDIVDVEELEEPKTSDEKQKQLQELEAQLAALLSLRGPKKIITHAGVKYRITRANEGKIRNCISAINRLKKELAEPVVEKEDVIDEALIKPVNHIETPTEMEDIYSDSSLVPRTEMEDIYSDSSLVQSDEEYEKENEVLFAAINKHAEDYRKEKGITPKGINMEGVMAALYSNQADFVLEPEKEKKKPIGFMKILKVKKTKDKKELKDKIKRAAVIIAASAILITSAVVSSILIKKNIDNNKNKDFDNVGPTTSDHADIEEDVSNNMYVEPEINVAETAYTLGSKFVINEGSLIYNNMYDATLNRDGETTYFEHDVERKIGGVAINMNGELKMFYINDMDAAANINYCIQNGGVITSVLSINENGYEGFYNINDVVVLNQTLGGNSR